MNKYLLFIAIMFTKIAFAQVVDPEKQLRTKDSDTLNGWKTSSVIGVNFSQSSFTNWAAGGQNSIAINSLFSLSAKYKSEHSSWDNFLDLGYGMQKQGADGKVIKTDDKLDFTSKYGKDAFKNWFYAALINFKSQMTPGYKYPNDSVTISDFLAPAYLTTALGMDFKKGENLSVFIAPVTGRITIVNSTLLADAGSYGVDAATYDTTGKLISHGKKMRSEFGGYMRVFWKTDVVKNVTFQTKIDFFSNYIKHPENIDINWEALVSMKVNKYIAATISTNLIYDDDVIIAVDKNNDGIIEENGPRIQFKEVLAIGFTYKF